MSFMLPWLMLILILPGAEGEVRMEPHSNLDGDFLGEVLRALGGAFGGSSASAWSLMAPCALSLAPRACHRRSTPSGLSGLGLGGDLSEDLEGDLEEDLEGDTTSGL